MIISDRFILYYYKPLNPKFCTFQRSFLKKTFKFSVYKATVILKKSYFSTDNKQVIEKLASEVEKAQLNDNEVQRLIDALLDKQNELRQWQKVRLNSIV